MAKVHICDVSVMNNPSPFLSPFRFQITFECIEELQDDLEWKMIYVGSAESEKYDQILDSILVGPLAEGKHMFIFEANPPDSKKIPVVDALGVTVVLLSCFYRDQEFVKIGYFINNEYTDPELKENPPSIPDFEKVTRNILCTEPRVTRHKINWDDVEIGTTSVPTESTDFNNGNSSPEEVKFETFKMDAYDYNNDDSNLVQVKNEVVSMGTDK